MNEIDDQEREVDPGGRGLDPLARALLETASHESEPPLPDLSSAAAGAGLLDVAYAKLDSPLGRLLLAATPRGLVRLAYVDTNEEDAVLESLAARVSPRVLLAPRK